MAAGIDDDVERTVFFSHSAQEFRVRLITDLDDVSALTGCASHLIDVDPNQVCGGTEKLTQQLEAPASIDPDLKHANWQAPIARQMAFVDREIVDPFVERIPRPVGREEGVEWVARERFPVVAGVESNAITLVD